MTAAGLRALEHRAFNRRRSLREADHGERVGLLTLGFLPQILPAGAIGRVDPLADDAFQTHTAGCGVDLGTLLMQRLDIADDARGGLRQLPERDTKAGGGPKELMLRAQREAKASDLGKPAVTERVTKPPVTKPSMRTGRPRLHKSALSGRRRIAPG